jgi:hypothetical protein
MKSLNFMVRSHMFQSFVPSRPWAMSEAVSVLHARLTEAKA